MTTPIYDVDYFIAKFEAIPEEQIGTTLIDRHCATWHCGVTDVVMALERPTPELTALGALFASMAAGYANNAYEQVYFVNDGVFDAAKLGPTPRARILAALREIKAKQ